eukprot:scaffold2868_cov171-Amphora_coffeaeformis.AAC.1
MKYRRLLPLVLGLSRLFEPVLSFWRVPWLVSRPDAVWDKLSFHKLPREGKKTKSTKNTSASAAAAAAHREEKGRRWVLPKLWARFMYVLTALNPALAVFCNDYAKMMGPYRPVRTQHLFFFARLKPRVTFTIGAMLRALQLTTAFQYVFDPSVGMGFGLDVLFLFAQSKWPATIVLGWSVTKPFWKALGANPPSGLPVPISISMVKGKGKQTKYD